MVEIQFRLRPADLRAIEVHKYFLSLRERREVPIEEAIPDFLFNYWEQWLHAKHRRDAMAQIEEILRYKWFRSEREGRDIGTDQAAGEWIPLHAAAWREHNESLEANDFVRLVVTVGVCAPQDGSTMAQLAEIVRRHYVDVYMHKPSMPGCSFMLGDRPYVDVRRSGGLRLSEGDTVEFIALGAEARDAFDEIYMLLGAHRVC